MEYVEGATLRDLIGPGGVGQEQALEHVTQLCRGLHEIHFAKPPLVHRDIKPGNLVVGERDGVLRIVDFGLGRDLGKPIQAASAAVGTPTYMSPEQLAGGTIDPRTDLYAASLVAYELLTGVVPMCDSVGNPDELARAKGWRVGDEGLTGSLATFFTQGLAAAPSLRFQSAEALMRAFESSIVSFQSSRPTPDVGRSTVRLSAKWMPSRRTCGRVGPISQLKSATVEERTVRRTGHFMQCAALGT
jgi:serine/threonine-protein kinase